MRNEDLDRQLAAARTSIADHWASCLEAGLSRHGPVAHAAVDQSIQDYFDTLKTLPDPTAGFDILNAMRMLFTNLDKLNVEANESLLETDERELLVPIVIAAAETAGLNIEDFDGGDPTLAFRNF